MAKNDKDKDKDAPMDVAPSGDVVTADEANEMGPGVVDTEELEGFEQDEPLDRVTNQRLSDFLPVSDEFADNVAIANAGIVASSGRARFAVAERTAQAAQANKERGATAKDDLKAVKDTTKRMFDEITMVPPDLYAARRRAEVAAEARMIGTKEIQPGGRFKVSGIWVNANGDRLDDQSDD
jgi:hypothetical protein